MSQQQVIVPLPAQQPKKATANPRILGLDTPTLFWILLGLHGIIITAEVYLAWKEGWIKW